MRAAIIERTQKMAMTKIAIVASGGIVPGRIGDSIPVHRTGPDHPTMVGGARTGQSMIY